MIDESNKCLTDEDLEVVLTVAATTRTHLGYCDLLVWQNYSASSERHLVRFLLSHLNDAPVNDTIDQECARRLSSLEEWEEILKEVMKNLPVTKRTIRVVIATLATKMASHPLGNLEVEKNFLALEVFDALDDGHLLRVNFDRSTQIYPGDTGILVSIEDPVRVWAACVCDNQNDECICLTVDRSSNLLSERRIVLPPSILVIQSL